MKNNYFAKIIRTMTCLLPVQKGRKGKCVHCGECCKLPKKCRFLTKDNYCGAYAFRTLNCRKYPRSAKEHITKSTCGYSFDIHGETKARPQSE